MTNEKPVSLEELKAHYASHREFKDVVIQSLGGVVLRVKMLSAADAAMLLAQFALIGEEDGEAQAELNPNRMLQMAELSASVARVGVVDEAFNPVFSREDGEALLASFDMDTLAEIQRAVFDFNGMTNEKDGDSESSEADSEGTGKN